MKKVVYRGIVTIDGANYILGQKLPHVKLNQEVQGAGIEEIDWPEGSPVIQIFLSGVDRDTFVAIDPQNVVCQLTSFEEVPEADTIEDLDLDSKDEVIEKDKEKQKKTVQALGGGKKKAGRKKSK